MSQPRQKSRAYVALCQLLFVPHKSATDYTWLNPVIRSDNQSNDSLSYGTADVSVFLQPTILRALFQILRFRGVQFVTIVGHMTRNPCVQLREKWIPGLFPSVKWPGFGADYPPLSECRGSIKSKVIYLFSLYAIMACYRVT